MVFIYFIPNQTQNTEELRFTRICELLCKERELGARGVGALMCATT